MVSKTKALSVTITLMALILLSGNALAASIELLGQNGSFVAMPAELVNWQAPIVATGGYYTEPGDDEGEVIYTSPAQLFAQGSAHNVVKAGASITLAAGKKNGTFISPIVVVPQFNVLMIAFNQKTPQGTTATVFVRIWYGNKAQKWQQVSREESILLPSTTNRLQYCVHMNSKGGSKSPSFSDLSVVAEETRAEEFLEETIGDVVSVKEPKIVEREEWGARKARSGSPRGDKINAIVVHHTGGASYKKFKGASGIQGTQNFHMDGRGWNDIAYHFLIGPDGTIYRGRPENVRGGHCPPNKGRLGVTVIGNFETGDELNKQNGRALKHLLSYLCGKYGLTTDRIKMHKEWRPTACPGKNIISKFDLLKDHVGRVLQKSATQNTMAD